MQSDGDGGLGGLSRQQLRMQKNRIIKYVEQLVPPSVLEAGALIMVMQVDSPGVNGSMYHTVVSVVFPLPAYEGHQFIGGIKESGEGGTYRTTIYRPIIDVTRDDVLDAFPEAFPGGRRTIERLSYRARDVAVAHLEQDFGEGNADSKREVAQFVIDSLQTYLERDCVPPPIGKAFPIHVSPEEEVIAAVAKTNMQRKEYAKTRKKAEKMVKDRDLRELEHQHALQAQQHRAMATALPPTPTKHSYSDDDSGDPFENVHNPLRYRDPPGDRVSALGIPLVVDIPSIVDLERSDERTAGTAGEFSTPSKSTGAKKGTEETGSSGRRKGSLKKMLRKKMQLRE